MITPARAAYLLTALGFGWAAIAAINYAAIIKWAAELDEDAFTEIPPTFRGLR